MRIRIRPRDMWLLVLQTCYAIKLKTRKLGSELECYADPSQNYCSLCGSV